jgi:redox-sensitive bicupin YhaK (pirin superfamily)
MRPALISLPDITLRWPMPSTREPGRVAIVSSHPELDDPSTRLLMPTAEQGPFLPFDRFAETVATGRESPGRHPHLAEEVVAYVLEGSIRHEEGEGPSTVLRPGSVLVLTAHEEIRHALSMESGTDDGGARWLSLVLRIPWHTEQPPTSLQIKDAGDASADLGGTIRRPVVGPRARADSSLGLECTDIEFTRESDIRLEVGTGRRGVAYVVRGMGTIEKHPVGMGQGALLDNVGIVTITGSPGFRVFVASVPVVGEDLEDESVEGRLVATEYPGRDGR